MPDTLLTPAPSPTPEAVSPIEEPVVAAPSTGDDALPLPLASTGAPAKGMPDLGALVGVPAAPQGEAGLMDAFNPSSIPMALFAIVIAVLSVRFLNRAVTRLSEQITTYRLLIKQVGTLSVFVIYVAAIVMAFSTMFTLSSEALLALSGTLAVTVGFALKDVAASFFAGISILFNKPFQVGDRISFGGYYGEVKEIGLSTVRLVTLDDNLVTIPTNKFLTDPVASANAGELDCMVVMTYHVSPQADHARALEIVNEAVLASKYLYLGKPMTVLVGTTLSEKGQVIVEINAKAYVYDTRFEKAFASDVTSRVLETFRAEQMPLPGEAEVLAPAAVP